MTKQFFHKRTLARIGAVQALYQVETTGASAQEALRDFKNHFEAQLLSAAECTKYDNAFLEKILLGVSVDQEKLDPLIQENLPHNWTFDRLEMVLLCILRAAIFELWTMPETDAAVIINEYVNVAHSFYDDKEPSFVNGLLHTVSTKLRS